MKFLWTSLEINNSTYWSEYNVAFHKKNGM